MLEHSSPGSTHIVYYKRMEEAFHRWGVQYENGHAFSFVSLTPIGLWKTLAYHDVYTLADYVVEVKPGEDRAIVRQVIKKCPIEA